MREGWLRPSLSASVRACVVRVRPSVRLFFLLANGAPGRGRRPLLPPSASPLRSESDFGGRSRMDHRCGGLSLLPIRVLGVDWHGMAATSIVHGDRSGLAQTVNLAKL